LFFAIFLVSVFLTVHCAGGGAVIVLWAKYEE
jgi:hypothetical protein